MKKIVSIVIPFYSGARWLEEAIDSVLKQTYKNIEIIVINDGSLENIDYIVKKYSGKISVFFQENKGAAAARNLGIEKSKGEYIAFLDSDDLFEEQKIEKQLKFMIEKGVVWSHTDYLRFQDRKILNNVVIPEYGKKVFPICIISYPIATPCVMIKTSILRENIDFKFNESMNSGEDSYLWMLLAINYDIGVLHESLTKVRIRGTNAALLAYPQLRAKAEFWLHLKNKKLNRDIGKIARLGFFLSYHFYRVFNFKAIQKLGFSELLKEKIAKIFYCPVWILFKIEKQKIKRWT